MAYLIHVANVLFLCSYLVRDILWLRLLSVIAGFCLIPYFYFQSPPLWQPILWNVVFISLNAFQIARLLRERRPVRFSDEEQRLYQMVFRSLTPREFAKLLKLAHWSEAAPAECLVEQNQVLKRMMVIYSGLATVKVGDAAVAQLQPGRLVGEMSFLTGEKTSASVWTALRTRYVAWPADDLKRFLADNHELRSALQLVIGSDLATKLRAVEG
ncbi:MAG TPA: cyclic nucleotide-binding domain-containing protein [Polyangia bacterium]|nr:cyclic nucleotide-binding domain-containing protein [Polyangia bacterium]